MTEPANELGAEFPIPALEDWKEKAEAALKGAAFDRLKSKTYDGITLAPLYTKADFDAATDGNASPGRAPFTRGTGFRDVHAPGWQMQSPVVHPDPKTANKEALRDLERGMSALSVEFDLAAQLGLAPGDERLANADTHLGVAIDTLDDLKTVLDGVHLDFAPVSLTAGSGFAGAAAFVIAHGQEGCFRFNADPLGALARQGSLPGSLDSAMAAATKLAVYTNQNLAGSRALAADATLYLDAGASSVQALGAALATAVAYLRALTGAGLSVEDAARQISFRLGADSDVFMGIAQIRALRRLWSRVLEASGTQPQAAEITVETAARAQTGCDPWVNILRGTAASFASAVGGADGLLVRPFDDAVRTPSEQARRVARNTQIILAEESHLARVADPAGGSYLFESLTDQTAQAAWAAFQAIEAKGGMAEVLKSGALADEIDATAQQRAVDIARRKLPITGVSEFPNIAEAELAGSSAKPARATQSDSAIEADTVEGWVAAAKSGATLHALTRAIVTGAPEQVRSFEPKPFAAEFEALRAQAKALAPKLFLANIGPIADHTARATFAKNFFEAGGIETLTSKGFDNAADLVTAFKDSGAEMAVLCGSDDGYDAHAADFARALKEAGCTMLYLAGRPGAQEEAWRAAGIDEFAFMGANLLTILTDALARASTQSGASS